MTREQKALQTEHKRLTEAVEHESLKLKVFEDFVQKTKERLARAEKALALFEKEQGVDL